MPCYHPMKAWRSKDPDDYNPETGKYKMTFNSAKGLSHTEVDLPCGNCLGCLQDRARTWAIRCLHEASLHKENCFITLTYDEEHYPKKGRIYQEDGSLNKSDFQKFMKRLRKRYANIPIRFYHCAEYGANLDRPHHHACIFGFSFPDRYPWSVRKDTVLYRSPSLESLWRFGYSTVGDVSIESACYVARYLVKKQFGKQAEDHYKGRLPEFNTMSRKPGIGKGWYDKYKNDLYNYDRCVVCDKFVLKPPRFYDNLYDLENPEHLAQLKQERIAKAKQKPDNDWKRLQVREKVAHLKIERSKRNFENPLT